MTITEFESYLQKGLGRAILLLRQEPDKAPFWEPLSCYILGITKTAYKPCYHHAIGEYEVDLIRCFEDHEKLADEIVKKLLSREDKYIPQYRSFLLMLGYGEALNEAIVGCYNQTYKALYDYQKEHTEPPYKDAHDIWVPYFGAATAMMEIYKGDKTNMLKLVTDIADLYDLSQSPVIPNVTSPVRPDTVGKEVMDEVYNNHRHGKEYKRDNEAKMGSYTQPPSDWAWSFERYEELSKASPEKIKEIAELALETEDEKERMAALKLFDEGISSDVINPVFPLQPSRLIAIAKDRIEQSRRDAENGAWYRELHLIISVLERVRNSDIASFAYELLNEKTLSPLIRVRGLHLLLSQGEPQDRETIIAYLDEWDELMPMESMGFLCGLIDNGYPDAPVERLPYYYENAMMCTYRERVLKAMQICGTLSDEIRKECLYDANSYIRDFIKNEKS